MDLINLEKAVRLMDGDQELFCDLFELIENTLAEKFGNVEAALASGSADDLELYAHQFKGAMRNVAAEEACAILERVEHCGKRGDLAGARDLWPQVRPVIERTLAAFHSRAWAAAFPR